MYKKTKSLKKGNIISKGSQEAERQASEGMMKGYSPRALLLRGANKLLSLKPYKNDDGLIEYLEISSTKNREKEQLQVRLSVNNTRIYKTWARLN